MSERVNAEEEEDNRVEKSPPTETLVRLAELVLTMNSFEFND